MNALLKYVFKTTERKKMSKQKNKIGLKVPELKDSKVFLELAACTTIMQVNHEINTSAGIKAPRHPGLNYAARLAENRLQQLLSDAEILTLKETEAEDDSKSG